MRALATVPLLLLAAGCVGPTLHPVTAPVPAGTELQITARGDSLLVISTGPDSAAAHPCRAARLSGRLTRQAGDTLWFDPLRQVDRFAAGSAYACVRQRTARVVLPRDSAAVERVQEAGLVRQAAGSALFMAAVGAAILLLGNAVIGILNVVGGAE